MRRPNAVLGFVSLCVILLTGCGSTDDRPAENARSAAPRIFFEHEGVLEFGQAPLFADGAATTVQKLAVFNVGTDILRLGAVEVSAANENSNASELEVRLPANVSVPARAGANVIEVDVRLTPTSLGPKAWQLKVRSNDPERPIASVLVTAVAVTPPPCRFTVSPNRIDLRQVQVPEKPTVVVTIANEGAVRMEQCLISNVRLASEADPAMSLPLGTIARTVLGPGESLQVPVRIVAPAQGTPRTINALLGFDISSSPQAHVAVPISAEALPGSCIEVAPDDLEFGGAAAGCTTRGQPFTVYSRCASDVVLTGYSIAGAGLPAGSPECPGTAPCPEFLFLQTPPIPSGGLVMKAGGSPVSYAMKYSPRDLGSDTGAVSLEFGEVTYAVALHGQGESPGFQTDVFPLDARPQLDLLFVIDRSASMADDQASLASNLSGFLQFMKAADVDFQLGVVTADPTAGATLLTGSAHPDAVLTRTSANLDAQFAAKVNVGTGGTAQPRCLEQAVAALTSPQNSALLRNAASLSVVCITDSTDFSPLSESDYVDQLWSVKGLNRKTLLTFSAIAGFSAACPGDQGRLANSVSLTNGVKDDLCAPDWQKVLESFGRVAFAYRTNVFLTSVPNLIAGPLEVSVDGTPLPPITTSGSLVWRYDPVGNSVNFEPMFVPEPGQTVTVRYPVLCVDGP